MSLDAAGCVTCCGQKFVVVVFVVVFHAVFAQTEAPILRLGLTFFCSVYLCTKKKGKKISVISNGNVNKYVLDLKC